MSEHKTAEEWGRLAVGLPGWRWMRGSRALTGRGNPAGSGAVFADAWPDPDDPATAGCLVDMLDGPVSVPFTVEQHRGPLTVMGTWVAIGQRHDGEWEVRLWGMGPDGCTAHGTPIGADARLGRACIAAAQHLGQWPNSKEST